MSGTGRVEAIWLKPERKGPMEPAREAELVAGRGLAGNAHQGGRRQVTVISCEAWEAVREELGVDVPHEARRANLLVSGVELEGTVGRILEVGGARMEIGGETRPCARMDEAEAGLKEAMVPAWRGGVYAVVLDDGRVRAGDSVRLSER